MYRAKKRSRTPGQARGDEKGIEPVKKMLLAAAALFAAAPASAEKVVVTAARMVDVLTGKVVENPAVFIGDDGRISAVADARTVRWGSDVRHVDLGARTLLPGFIDMHVHLDNPAEIGGYRSLEFTDSFFAVFAVGAARAMLDSGFTTVRNLGSGERSDVGLKQAIEAGFAVGPRIVPAGYSIGATGGHCDSTFLPPSLETPQEGVADGPQALRGEVRRQRKYGAEVIKVCATGGVFSRNTEPGQPQLSEEELRAIVDEANQWGLRVAAHAHGAEGIKRAIRAGVDTIEHASLADPEAIRLCARRKFSRWSAVISRSLRRLSSSTPFFLPSAAV